METSVTLDRATVYDYNRHGIVAFKGEGINVEQLKAWAETGQKLVVYIVPMYEVNINNLKVMSGDWL